MAYSWIIDQDHIDGEDVGVTGPQGTTTKWAYDMGIQFKMYDDDGNLYYTGRYMGDDSEDMFAPLDDFGMPNAGCTGIKYKNETTGEWEYL